jgi:hypothetical protein
LRFLSFGPLSRIHDTLHFFLPLHYIHRFIPLVYRTLYSRNHPESLPATLELRPYDTRLPRNTLQRWRNLLQTDGTLLYLAHPDYRSPLASRHKLRKIQDVTLSSMSTYYASQQHGVVNQLTFHSWSISYVHRPPLAKVDYEKEIKRVATFGSVCQPCIVGVNGVFANTTD